DAVDARRFDRVKVDEGVVPDDRPVIRRYEPHASHVGSEGVHLVDATGGDEAVVPTPKVEDLELVGRRLAELGPLRVDAPDPVALALQVGEEVTADEPAGTRHHDPVHARVSVPSG